MIFRSLTFLYFFSPFFNPLSITRVDKQNHINGIENFWNQAKRHMRRFNGIKLDNFYYFLKECEWRFNGGNHQVLLKQLKYWDSHTKH